MCKNNFKVLICAVLLVPLAAMAEDKSRHETDYNAALARRLGGECETRYAYPVADGIRYIRVDIETADYVIEAALDRRSARDSVHQALFAASLTGKKPKIVIYDTDGRRGAYEIQIERTARAAKVAFERISIDTL